MKVKIRMLLQKKTNIILLWRCSEATGSLWESDESFWEPVESFLESIRESIESFWESIGSLFHQVLLSISTNLAWPKEFRKNMNRLDNKQAFHAIHWNIYVLPSETNVFFQTESSKTFPSKHDGMCPSEHDMYHVTISCISMLRFWIFQT